MKSQTPVINHVISHPNWFPVTLAGFLHSINVPSRSNYFPPHLTGFPPHLTASLALTGFPHAIPFSLRCPRVVIVYGYAFLAGKITRPVELAPILSEVEVAARKHLRV